MYDNNKDNRSNLVAMIDDDRGVPVNIPSLFIVGSDGFHIKRLPLLKLGISLWLFLVYEIHGKPIDKLFAQFQKWG